MVGPVSFPTSEFGIFVLRTPERAVSCTHSWIWETTHHHTAPISPCFSIHGCLSLYILSRWLCRSSSTPSSTCDWHRYLWLASISIYVLGIVPPWWSVHDLIGPVPNPKDYGLISCASFVSPIDFFVFIDVLKSYPYWNAVCLKNPFKMLNKFKCIPSSLTEPWKYKKG